MAGTGCKLRVMRMSCTVRCPEDPCRCSLAQPPAIVDTAALSRLVPLLSLLPLARRPKPIPLWACLATRAALGPLVRWGFPLSVPFPENRKSARRSRACHPSRARHGGPASWLRESVYILKCHPPHSLLASSLPLLCLDPDARLSCPVCWCRRPVFGRNSLHHEGLTVKDGLFVPPPVIRKGSPDIELAPFGCL